MSGKSSKHSSTRISRHNRQHQSGGFAGVYKGKKFVKRAGMWVEYENYNRINTPDKRIWSMEGGGIL